MRRSRSILSNVDTPTLLLYLSLVMIGWISIYAAVYNELHHSIFSMSQLYGKQLLWIIAGIVIAGVVLTIDSEFYTTFAYVIYGLLILSLLFVFVAGDEVNGAKSWIKIGGFSLQPSEFAKFATALALSKYLSGVNIKFNELKAKAISLVIIAVPVLFILLQNDTGSAIVYGVFILVIFRKGLINGNILLFGLGGALIAILTLILRRSEFTWFDFTFSGTYLLMGILTGITVLVYYILRKVKRSWIVCTGGLIIALGLVVGIDYFFDNVLKPYQVSRINITLGLESDPKGAGYNLEQSLIAIGSGGFSGKGFLEGTQTKFNFVPEQSTDFIFCTIGEEWGFLGTFVTIVLYVALFLRLLFLAERQRSEFSRIYGYSVACILFFHFMINVGMTIGLAPVIGIPLPFISYGGSSMWSFTILLFIFLKLDSDRLMVFR
jgi:rod shape determining protein RodA